VIALSASQSGADHADPAVRRTALRGARMLIEVFDLPAARPAVPQWTAMKEGLLGGTLSVFTEERARGGPSSCCTLVWI
jgi:hypothetical protein